MRLEIHVYHHVVDTPGAGHSDILAAIANLSTRLDNHMTKFTDEIADLNAELSGLTDAVTANGALIDAILDSVDENAADETALRELVTSFRAQKDALVANTLKGTPSDPAPEPTPEG